jgi:hypothetical protein
MHMQLPRWRLLEGSEGCACCCAADKAMGIAADTCIYTNHNFTHLMLKSEAEGPPSEPVDGV